MEPSAAAKILVISSNQSLRQSLTSLLRDPIFEVTDCDSLRSAFFAIVSQPIDLVLADDVLLDGEILDFISRLRLGGNKIPFIILTQADREYQVEEMRRQQVEVIELSSLRDSSYIVNVVKHLLIESPKSSIKRRFQRRTCNLDVFFETVRGGEVSLSKGMSLGLGGMFLATSYALPRIGDFVSFRIAPSHVSPVEVEGVGVVRWVRERSVNGDPSGFAIEFIGLTADTRERVSTMISYLTP
ncbi:MAG: hypothetical protein A4S09_12660 [Proteobacteria bacterium SG_bin7]|nr:MAG: hypothetical protein A4S09_12660 [Proteobacteria bacterium SG_bin7]